MVLEPCSSITPSIQRYGVSGLVDGNQLDLRDILFGAAATQIDTANEAGTGGTLSVGGGVDYRQQSS
jgi:hypothetical protein